MDFPGYFGLGFAGDDSAVDQNLNALVRMQGIGAYSDDPASYRVRELLAFAIVLAHAQMTLEEVSSLMVRKELDRVLRARREWTL